MMPYHPQMNGLAERVHQTLLHMIGKLDLEKRKKWPSHIGSIIIAYNSTQSLVTVYSPYYLMFRRRPWLPIDLLFLTHRTRMMTHTIDEYISNLSATRLKGSPGKHAGFPTMATDTTNSFLWVLSVQSEFLVWQRTKAKV